MSNRTIMEHSLRGSEQTDITNISEAEAIRLASGGDSNAFERLYKLHSRRVYGLCLRLAGNPTEAEDLTQEAFLQLFRKIHTFRGESSFSTWLHRLAVNIALMRFRKKKRPEVSLDASAEPGEGRSEPLLELGGFDLRLSGVLDHVNLSKAIDQLAEGYKQIFILHDVEGYGHKEIAEILGCSVGTSKSQLFKARLVLRKLLHECLRSHAREERDSIRSLPMSEQRKDRKTPKTRPSRATRYLERESAMVAGATR
jgi:RNA polymerase sigma-70 factor (ECF subfamily)